MDIQVKETGKLSREISVVIPKDVVEKHFEERCAEVGKTMKIDGFRPGKVPLNVVKQRHGEQIFHEMEHNLIEMGLGEAQKQHNLTIAGAPKIDHEHSHEVKDFAFTANVEVFPEIKVAGLDSIKLTKEISTPDDKMMEKALADLQSRMQSFADKDGAAAMEDRVVVTGQGYKVEGKKETAFEGGNLKEFPIVLGSNSLIPGFEEQLVGAKAGDKVDVNVTFPKEYHAADLAGAKSVFKLTVDKVEAVVKEEFNDEFAQKLGQENLAGLKDLISKSLQQDLNSATEQRLKRHMFDHLDAKNTFELPEGLVERELGGLIQSQINQLARQGLTPEQAGMDMDSLKKEFADVAARRVKLGLLLAEIAKEKQVQIGEEDIRKAIMQQVMQAGQQAEQVQKYFSDPRNRQQLVGPLLEEKVTAQLLADATVTEKEVDAEELLKEFE